MIDINLMAPINQLGYGVVAVNLVKTLFARGVRVALWPIGSAQAPPQDYPLLRAALENARKFNHLAPSVRLFHQFDLAPGIGKGPRIGFPIFELDRFNDVEVAHLNSCDFLFTGTQWAKRVLENAGIRPPVKVVNFGVDRALFNESLHRPGRDTAFVNVGKWEIRKGHDVLLEAFCKAFNPSDPVRLYMHCHNPFLGEQGNEQWRRRYLHSPMGSRIFVSGERKPLQSDLLDLLALADVGVFPSRAEGWNLELLEFMSCGKQVIATNVTGHTEFCSAANAHLIELPDKEAAFDGTFFHGQGHWHRFGAEQVDRLANLMRELHRQKLSGQLAVNQQAIDTAKRFTWDHTASQFLAALPG